MKKLYELCVKAFTEGKDIYYLIYEQTPLAFDKDTFWIDWHPSNPNAMNLNNPDMQAPSYFYGNLKISDTNGITCTASVGIYPYDNGQRIYFYSGCRVFDIAITPKIQQALGGVLLEHYSFDKSNPNINKHYREDLPF